MFKAPVGVVREPRERAPKQFPQRPMGVALNGRTNLVLSRPPLCVSASAYAKKARLWTLLSNFSQGTSFTQALLCLPSRVCGWGKRRRKRRNGIKSFFSSSLKQLSGGETPVSISHTSFVGVALVADWLVRGATCGHVYLLQIANLNWSRRGKRGLLLHAGKGEKRWLIPVLLQVSLFVIVFALLLEDFGAKLNLGIEKGFN